VKAARQHQCDTGKDAEEDGDQAVPTPLRLVLKISFDVYSLFQNGLIWIDGSELPPNSWEQRKRRQLSTNQSLNPAVCEEGVRDRSREQADPQGQSWHYPLLRQ
jgi:hypothetical protein